MRPLTLHSSALSDSEYSVYISCLRDLAEDDEGDMQHNDSFYEDFAVGAREARAWLRGRYPTLAPNVVDSILRLFCPKLASTDVLTGGQLFAVLRLVHHVLSGKEVDKGLVFVQAYPDALPSQPQLNTAQALCSPIEEVTPPYSASDLPSPDVNPFFAQRGTSLKPPIASSSASAPPPVGNGPPTVPPKPTTNPFLARRGSEEGRLPSGAPERPSFTGTASRARSVASIEGRTPPLPPRKPVIPPPRHSSQAHAPHHSISVSSSSPNPNMLIQQSLQATRVAQSLKKAEQRLEQERVLEVLKSSAGSTRRTRSNSPMHDNHIPSSSPSVASSAEREKGESARVPTLPPRRKISPPASTISGSTTRSLEQVARASVSYKAHSLRAAPPPLETMQETQSPSRTPPRPLVDLPPEPPPTHPDRKPVLIGFDDEHSLLPAPDSPRVFRSRSMHYPSAPPIPPHRKRPESIQLTPTGSPTDSPFASPVHPHFPSTALQPSLSRHHSLSSSLSGRSRHSEVSAISEPIANLHKTLTTLHQKAQPRLDSARYKAEAAFNPRGFVQHSQPSTRWMRQEGEEALMDDVDDDGEGKDDSESVVQDTEDSDGEKVRNERLRKLQMGYRKPGDDDEGGELRRVGTERDDLKWPVGEGWKRL